MTREEARIKIESVVYHPHVTHWMITELLDDLGFKEESKKEKSHGLCRKCISFDSRDRLPTSGACVTCYWYDHTQKSDKWKLNEPKKLYKNAEKERRKKLKFEMRHPNICVCDDVYHKQTDEKVGEDFRYSVYDFEQINPIPCNIFRCSKCGKEYNDAPAEA